MTTATSLPTGAGFRYLRRPAAVFACLFALAACGSDNPPAASVDAGTDTPIGTGDAGFDAGADTSADAGDDTGDTSADAPADTDEDAQLPTDQRISVLETVVVNDTVRAGEPIEVSCEARGVDGEPMSLPDGITPNLLWAPRDSLVFGDEVISTRPGRIEAWCSAPAAGLLDTSPAIINVVPGEVDRVVTYVEPHRVMAGEPVSYACEAYDAYGNWVDTEFDFWTDPRDVTQTEDLIGAAISGLYTATCGHPDARLLVSDIFEVTPAEPAALSLTLSPNRSLYAVGEIVTLVWSVTDQFGNEVDTAPVETSSIPEVTRFGQSRFRLDVEGETRLIVTVPRFDGDDEPLVAFVDVNVNGGGPSIVCETPEHGAMLNMPPGAPLHFAVGVSDALGVSRVEIDGVEADFVEGSYSRTIPTRYGINFVDVDAYDSEGEPSSTTCAFLVADNYVAPNTILDDGVSLVLAQNAIDDNNRSGALNSLGDVLHTALNSSGVRDAIHGSFSQSPQLMNECIEEVPIFGGCLLRVKVRYLDSRVRGPNDVRLQLVNGGIRAVANIRNAGVKLDIDTSILDTSGWVTLSHLGVDMTLFLGISGGNPTVTRVQLNGSPTVGGVDTDFSGLSGDILNIVADLFEGTIRDEIRDALRDFMTDSFDEIVAGLVEGLDISSLGTDFDVPRLDDGPDVNLGLGVGFSTLNTNSSRALFGLGLRFTGSAARPPGLGAPVPPGDVLLDPSTSRSVAAGISLGVLEQALYALWRAGWLDATVSSDSLSDLPDGAEATITTSLPPVVAGTADGRIALQLGAMDADVLIPGIFADPITVRLGAIASTSVTVAEGDVITFGDVRIDELSVATPGISLAGETLTVLENFLIDVIDAIALDALNSALPVLPIPTFELPSSLTEFGLPAGAELGLTSTSLGVNTTHFTAEGDFGVR